jgi:hypothetical protein
MHLPRRTFLKSGAFAAVSAGLALSSGRLLLAQRSDRSRDFQIPLTAETNPLFSFTRETFEPYVGDIFQAPNARGEMISLTLTHVRNYRAKDTTKLSSKTPRELRSFSLTFHSEEKLPQFSSIHTVSHPALGEFDLFLTSSQRNDGTFIYEAVFSHL